MKPWKTAAFAAVLVLSGCGGQMDSSKVERDIAESVRLQTGVTVEVSCPENIDIEVGRTFHCLVYGEGERAMADVTIENEDGEYTWRT